MIDFAASHVMYTVSGFLVGLLVGQTGVGGGSLMTPLLVLLFGVSPSTAVGTDLLYACATKSVGTMVHGLNRTVDWRIVLRLAAGSIPGTLGILLIMHMGWFGDARTSRGVITTVLGVTLLLTAVSLVIRPRILALATRLSDGPLARHTAALTVVTGAILGMLVTITSVGAGALGVTALLLLYPRLPIPRVVGSDIAHAVPLTLVAGIGHLWLGSVDGILLLSLLAGSLPGIAIGSHLSARLPDVALRLMLAAVLALVGGRLVF